MRWGQCEIIICKWVFVACCYQAFGAVRGVGLIKSGRSHWTWAIGTHSSSSAVLLWGSSISPENHDSLSCTFCIFVSLFAFWTQKHQHKQKRRLAAGVLLFLLASALFVCCLFGCRPLLCFLHFSALSFFAFCSCQRTKRAKLWAERTHARFSIHTAHPHMRSNHKRTTNDAGEKFELKNRTGN